MMSLRRAASGAMVAKQSWTLDHLDPLLGGRKCNELQVSGVNGVNKIGSYCIRRLFSSMPFLSPTASFTLRFPSFTTTERFLTFAG